MENLNDAITKYTEIEKEFGKKSPLKHDQPGAVVFAGNYWPKKEGELDKKIEHDVKYAFVEARRICNAYIACKAAIRGNNKEHVNRMEKWFGQRTDGQPKDWWTGVSYILGAIETHIMKDINIYYRGDRNLIGKKSDYPNEDNNIVAYDIKGYAESNQLVKDNIIGLCEDFFMKNKKLDLKKRNCVGGLLIHELSHNICGADDHAYGEELCKNLAENHPELAWHNADNIQLFFEDVVYNI